MADAFYCWKCRQRIGQVLKDKAEQATGKCALCHKTREQKQPVLVKQQPPTKKQRQKEVRLRELGLIK